MALTIANECKAAALDGITALLNGGTCLLSTAGSSPLGAPTFGSPAFGAATVASPAVASQNTATAAAATPGTIGLFAFRTSGAAARISGTVGVGAGDLQVSDDVIPATAESINVKQLQISLQIT